jgi:hypothetical protein
MATQTRAPTSDFATGGTVDYSSGSTGYTLVNDYPDTADPLTSYVTLGTTTNSFIVFGFTAFDVPVGRTITSVAVQYTDEEPANGANSTAGRLRVGGTYYDASTHNPSTTTTSRTDTWSTNPSTGSAWTVADVNGTGSNPLQNFGVIGPDSSPVWRLGSIQIVVTFSDPVVHVGQTNLTGSGIVSPKSTYTGAGRAALTVTGSIVAASTYIPATIGFRITESGDFRITEASDSRITEKYLDGQTALTASGTMTAAGDITMGGVVHFGAHDGTSAATLTATGSRTQLGSSNLSSSGTLVVTGVRIQPGVVSLSSTSTIEAFGDIAAILETGSANLQASGNLTTLGTLTLAGKVSLTTTGSKIVVAVNNMQGQFTGEATSTLTSNGLKFIYVSKSFAATSSINASGSLTLNGSTQVSAQSTLSAAAINRKIGQTSLSASGSLIVVPSKKLKGTLNVTASLSSTVVGTRIPFTSIAYVKVAGVWTEVDPYAKHESVWKAPEFMYKKISGAWKRIY